jgi:hypothetical protein
VQLAETIKISPGEAAVIIAVLLVIFLVMLGVYVGACVCAYQAGRGSREALVAWIGITVTGLALYAPTAEVDSLGFVALLVAVQFVCFGFGREKGPRP